MFKLLMTAALMMGFSTAQAQTSGNHDGHKEIRVMAGGNGLATDYGLEYEQRAGNLGMDAFGVFSKKREAQNAFTGNPEQWLLGVGSLIHLPDGTDFDIYLGPQIALIYQKDVPADHSNVFSAGPALKIGTMYAVTPMVSLGFDFLWVSNWFSDKIPSAQQYANFSIGFRF